MPPVPARTEAEQDVLDVVWGSLTDASDRNSGLGTGLDTARYLIEALAERGMCVAPFDPRAFLIWSNEHRAWWRANSAGYTTFVRSAGRYTEQEAIDICRDARNGFDPESVPTEIPVRAADVHRCLPTLTNTAGVADEARQPEPKASTPISDLQEKLEDEQ